jgi:tetratricopeptide (TPR) repeat protein
MLALIAAPLVLRHPDGTTTPIQPLNAAHELEEIDRACKLTDAPVAIDIQTEIATVEALNRTFGSVRGGFDIVHFSGHGSAGADGGTLVLEDATDLGAARLVGADELRDLLGDKPCRLAFLSACHSEGLAAALLDRGVAHVVAINADDTILAHAAQVFARHFYNVLLSGRSVREAFDRAVQGVRLDDALRTVLNTQTLAPVSLEEAVKFLLLPPDDAIHDSPLVPLLPPGEVRFRRPPWGERTNLSITPGGGAFFVGRQQELHAVTRALASNRCVSITGMGGMGKTALADAAGRWQHERARWPDGVVLVELRNAQHATDARVAIASALLEARIGLADPAQASGSDSALASMLRDHNMLLILDDLDALLKADAPGARALLKKLLGTRALHLLLTSRKLISQQIVHQRIELQGLRAEGAIIAFGSYAPPDTWGASTPADQAALPDLIAELAGYPFAIRLAAAYLRVRKCGIIALLKQLRATPEQTLQFLGEDADRETSLAKTLDISYQALAPEERTILAALALFPAGLNRAAARAILDAAGERMLETLADYAMAELHNDDIALATSAEDQAALQRFLLPEPARRYVEYQQETDLSDRYAPAALAYFQEFIDSVDSQISGQGKALEGRRLLTLEQPNWRRFLDWGYTNEHEQGICRSARATARLGNYWALTGEQGLPAVLERLQGALVAAQRLADATGEANVLKAIGDVQQFRDEREAALASYQQALTLYRQLGDRLGEANVLKALGAVQQFRKQSDAALASYQLALTLYRQLGNRLGEANVLKAIGDVQQFRDERDAALASYQQTLTLYRQLGNRLGEANVLVALGAVQQFRDEREAALASYQLALTLFRQIGDRLGEANVLAAQSRLLLDDDPEMSKQLLEQALGMRQAIGDLYSEGADLANYGIALLQRGENQAALEYLQRARVLFLDPRLHELLPQIDHLIAQARDEQAA